LGFLDLDHGAGLADDAGPGLLMSGVKRATISGKFLLMRAVTTAMAVALADWLSAESWAQAGVAAIPAPMTAIKRTMIARIPILLVAGP
jgi:hypothetical protein